MGRFIDGPSGGITTETNAPGITVLSKGGTTIVDFCYGTFNWCPPTGITQVTFEVWGGGGQSGSLCCCICGWGSASAAGGGYASYTASVTPSDVYTICVGCGGGQCVGQSSSCIGCQGCSTIVTGGYFSTVGCPLTATGGGGSQSTAQYTCGGSPGGGNSTPGYGCGPIGTISMCGSMGNVQASCNMIYYSCNSYGFGGNAPKTSGVSWTTYDHCNYFRCGCPATFPGGGAETAIIYTYCCCCSYNSYGASGLARLTY